MAKLVRCVLTEANCFSEDYAATSGPLRPSLDFEELRIHKLDSEAPMAASIEVGFEFGLEGRNGYSGWIAASFQLTYCAQNPLSYEDRVKIAHRRAPRDAWPVFRAHVDRVLSEMGLPKYHGKRHPPSFLEALAPRVLHETTEIDAVLMEQRANGQP